MKARNAKRMIAMIAMLIAVVLSFASLSFAAETPAVIISPSSETFASDAIFVSVKVSEPAEIRVRIEAIIDGEVLPVREPVTKEGITQLWYYTERVENVEPGLYCITVETKNENDNFVPTAATYFHLTEPTEEEMLPETTEVKEPTGLQKLVQIIKNLFTK